MAGNFLHTFNIRRTQYFIRPINPVLDTVFYFKYMKDQNVLKFTNINVYTSIDIARRDLYYFSQFDGVKDLCLGITNSDNELIGTIGYNCISFIRLYLDSNNRSANYKTHIDNKDNGEDYIYEVVGDLNFEYWGLGIMRHAGLFLIDYARSLCIDKLYATVLIDNKRAINLLKKFGCSIIKITEQNNKECYLYCLSI